MTNVDDPDKVGAMTIEVQPVIESDLGEFGEDSLEIDIDFEKSLNPQETGPYNEGMNSGLFLEAHVTTEKSIVLFEPLPHGIGSQLKNIG